MPSALIQPLVPGPVRQTKILLPEGASYRKVILFKIRLRPGEPWFGSGGDGTKDPDIDPGPITVPYNLNIDEAEIDGLTLRERIHLRMTGILERRYGQFIYQKSDQMLSTLVVQEVEELDWLKHKDRIWSEFVRWEPSGA